MGIRANTKGKQNTKRTLAPETEKKKKLALKQKKKSGGKGSQR